MSQRSHKQAELFKLEQRIIGRAGNQALLQPVEIPPAVAGFTDKYELLALGFYDGFRHALLNPRTRLSEPERKHSAVLSFSGGPQFGYLVMGRWLGHASRAYSAFCQGTERQPAVDELVATLKAPTAFNALVHSLANIPGNFCHPQEEAFGLNHDTYDASLKPGAKSILNAVQLPDETILLLPRADLSSQADAQCQWDTLAGYTEYERCPALAPLLPNAWPAMIDYAATDPNYFQADLA